MKDILVRSLLVSSMLLAPIGCYIDEPPAQYAAEDDGASDLVEVAPGVEVIADYPEPVFFANDYYWSNRGGIWYQSTWYGGGWARAGGRVPGQVIGIAHPEGYVHYRPTGYVAHERVRGGYESHAQYHATHAVANGSFHVRAAVRGGQRH